MGIRTNCICIGVLAALLVTQTHAQSSYAITPSGNSFWHSPDRSQSGVILAPDRNSYNSRATALIKSPIIKPTGTQYVQRVINKPVATLGAMAKKAVKFGLGPLGLILTAIEAAGYLVDDAEGTVTGDPKSLYQESEAGVYATGPGGNYCNGSVEQFYSSKQAFANACSSEAQTDFPGSTCSPNSGNSITCRRSNGNVVANLAANPTTSQPIAVNDDELGRELRDSDDAIARGLTNEAIKPGQGVDVDPTENPVYDPWEEAKDILEDLQDQINDAENDADTNNDGELSPQEIEDADPFRPERRQLEPKNPPDINVTVEVDIPTDCDLFNPGCQIRDWLFEDEPEPALPEAPSWDVREIGTGDLPDVQDQLGAASCPTDTFDVFGQTYNVPWTPICDLFIAVKPLVMAASSFLALFIVAGGLGGKK